MPTTTSKSLIVIPARMGSIRFPGKPMVKIGNLPLVHWTYNQAKRSSADYVVVATPDREIGGYCQENGLTWMPTSEKHHCGTNRCAELLERVKPGMDIGVVVNWQCDEPMVDPHDVNRMIGWIESQGSGVITLMAPITNKQMDDPHMVKVVVTATGRCHWFSRAPMAGARGHCGVYGFTANMLRALQRVHQSPLAEAEGLEQLSWIEHDYHVYAMSLPELPLAINAPLDVKRFEILLREKQNAKAIG